MTVEQQTDEATALRTLVKLCQQDKLLERPQGLEEGDSAEGLNDEGTLLRFLRGRINDPHPAHQQFKDSLQTRESINALSNYENIDINDFEAARSLYPHWTGHRDHRGYPIFLFDLSFLTTSATSSYKTSTSTTPGSLTPVQRTFAYHDSIVRFILPLCSAVRDRPNPDIPVLSGVYLVDASSFGVKQAWDVRGYAEEISQLLGMSFPEVVDTVFVLNAPIYFSKLWSILKSWVNPRTASKLVVVGKHEVLPTLTQSMDPSSIPAQFGGELEFGHGDLPKIDEVVRETVEWPEGSERTVPAGPIKWTTDSEGRTTAVALGKVHGEARRQVVATLRKSAPSSSSESTSEIKPA